MRIIKSSDYFSNTMVKSGMATLLYVDESGKDCFVRLSLNRFFQMPLDAFCKVLLAADSE